MNKLKTKFIFLFTLIVSLLIAIPATAKTSFFNAYPKMLAKPKTSSPRILLIGNSLTYYNYNNHGIQYVLSNLCAANGIDAEVVDITKGGHYLYQCSDEKDPLHSKIEAAFQQKWDYVILQGATSEPIEKPSEMLQTIEQYFMPKIKSAGAQMVLYMTWAPEKISSNDQSYDMNARQAAVTNFYYKLGEHFKCAVAPSGLAFVRSKELYPNIDLHYSHSDRLHPNCTGTYLSASSIFATLFNRSPYGTVFYPTGTTQINCGYMQAIAADVTTRIDTSCKAKLTFSSKGYTVNKGKIKKLSASLSSGGRVIRWTSANKEIATVSSSGIVKGISNGRTTITALLNNNTTASCDVIVTPTTLTMGVNEKYKLEFPNKFTWSSSNNSVAKMQKGIVTTYKKGSAVLTGKDSAGVIVKLNVKVKSAPTSVKIAKTKIIGIGRIAKLNASIKSGVSYSKLTFKSSNPDIVSVDKNGVLTAKRVGKVKITAKSYNGKKGVCLVQCVIPAQKMRFKNAESPLVLKRGKTKNLKVAFTPSNTTIKTLKWKSSNKKIVSISSKGKIKALKKGTATISATTTDGSKITIKLKVKVK